MGSTRKEHFFANACHVCRAYGQNILLKRCSSCKSIAYCNREHQKADWPKHKELCRVLSDIIKVNGKLHERRETMGLETWVEGKRKLMKLVQNKLGRKLLLHEEEILKFPRCCDICYETDPLQLNDCNQCPDFSFCIKHPKNSEHSAKCKASKLCFMLSNMFFHPMSNILACMAIGSHHEEKVPENMERAMSLFLMHCPANKTDVETKLWLKTISDSLSRPYSLLYAMEKLTYPKLEKMTIHVIDTNPKETYPANIWQLVLHHIPSLEELKVVFVGSHPATDPEDLRLCPDCISLERKIIVQTVCDSYVNFAADQSFTKPDYVIGFNLQICGNFLRNGLWTRTFKILAELGCPFAVTSSCHKGFRDHQLIMNILLKKKLKYCWAGRNPMSGLNPRRDMKSADFWYFNQNMTVYKKLA